MFYQRIYVILFCGILFNFANASCQDKQHTLHEKNVANMTNNKPINLQTPTFTQCPKNMAPLKFNTTDNTTIIVCDCKLQFLYYSANDSCYQAYRQGPCDPKEYLILPDGEQTAKCVNNPCEVDGRVPYNGTCYPLQDINGPCETDKILDVDEITFRIQCKDINVIPFIILQTPKKDCPSGSRRNALGVCKQPI